MIGRTLAHYEIVAKLGAGGMGEVYRARDTRLERDVALKILPEDLAGSQERLERFEREAKAVAAINHPNIVAIHSAEEADGVRFLTMELVEGRSLDQLIPEQGLALDRFFNLAVPLADALAAAHAAGIVHRDLKPSNIMVSTEGRVKVLDFGLARLRQPVARADTTQAPTEAITDEGRIVGTLPYMSPEQVQGVAVDHRSDIFSLGSVLYEMLTGRRPFRGDTSPDLMSSILRDTPTSATELRPELPAHLGRILKRCLEKRPERRTQSALDLRNDLEDLQEGLAAGEAWTSSDTSLASSPFRRARVIPWAVVATLALATAVYFGIRSRSETSISDSIPNPTFTQLTSAPGQEQFPTLSPDGEFVAYASPAAGNWDIYLQRVGGSNPMNLTGSSDADESEPAYSPDGQQIAFSRDHSGIFVMGATGESIRRLTDIGADPDWSPDGQRIVFSTQSANDPLSVFGQRRELWVVDSTTGATRPLGTGLGPRWSPAGEWIAYWNAQGAHRKLFIVATEGGEPSPLVDDEHNNWGPAWGPGGDHLYFSSDRGGSANLWRVRFDQRTGATQGVPEPLTTGIGPTVRYASLSTKGTRLVYSASLVTQHCYWIGFDPENGTILGEPHPITSGTDRYVTAHPSPGGEWIALVVGRPGDLAVVRRNGSDLRRLTDDSHRELYPRWAPDGETIAFTSNRSGSNEIWVIGADGANLRQLTHDPTMDFVDPAWSPDGTRLSFFSMSKLTAYMMDATKPWDAQQLVELRPDDPGQPAFGGSAWSSDGRRLGGAVVLPEVTGKAYERGTRVFDLETRSYVAQTDTHENLRFLRDGRRVLIYDTRTIDLLDLESGEAVELLSAAPYAFGRTYLAADESFISYGLNQDETDLWLMEIEGGSF